MKPETNNNAQNTRGLTPEVIQACNALLTLGLTTPSHVADVFVSWSPHCDNVSVDVHLGGWRSGESADRNFGASLSHKPSDTLAYLIEAKKDVEAYLASFNAETPGQKKARELAAINARIDSLRSEAARLEGST